MIHILTNPLILSFYLVLSKKVALFIKTNKKHLRFVNGLISQHFNQFIVFHHWISVHNYRRNKTGIISFTTASPIFMRIKSSNSQSILFSSARLLSNYKCFNYIVFYLFTSIRCIAMEPIYVNAVKRGGGKASKSNI